MNLAKHEQPDYKLPYLLDDALREYWGYQVARIKCAEKTGFCENMVPVAKALKKLAEEEMTVRGMNWNILKTENKAK